MNRAARVIAPAFGGLDTQVLPKLNEGPVRQALAGNAGATITWQRG